MSIRTVSRGLHWGRQGVRGVGGGLDLGYTHTFTQGQYHLLASLKLVAEPERPLTAGWLGFSARCRAKGKLTITQPPPS